MKAEEAIKYLQQLYPNGGHCWLDKQRIEAISMAVKALQEKHVSKDLEEAAKEQARSYGYYSEDYEFKENVESFKAGAQWHKEQMMANSADAMIGLPYENKDGEYTHLIDVSRPLPVGNNKIAIIFKED